MRRCHGVTQRTSPYPRGSVHNPVCLWDGCVPHARNRGPDGRGHYIDLLAHVCVHIQRQL